MRAVLFDWRVTLVLPPSNEEWVSDALRRVDRRHSPTEVAALVTRILEANGPEDRLDAPGIDTDQALHRAAFMDVLRDAEVDDDLAEALYDSESDYTRNPFAADAGETIRALNAAGLRIGVVSDIHFDVRPSFAAAGLGGAIDSYSLSYEVGVQKPDPRFFDHALRALDVRPEEALMVGDRSGPDGGAVEHGIPTLLLPPLRSTADARLRHVVRLAT